MIYAAERAAAVCATLAKLKTTTGTIDAAAAGGVPDRQNSFTLDGHSYPLTSNSTAIDLKAALAAKRGRSVGDCYVVYGGKPMNDEAAVEAPTGGEVTQAIFRVKVDGKTELIPASDESTVDELKAAVAAKIGRAVGGAFYFAVAGKPLTGSTIRKLRAQGKKIELCSRPAGFLGATDQRMSGRLRIRTNQQLFVELFSWPQARALNFNISIWMGIILKL